MIMIMTTNFIKINNFGRKGLFILSSLYPPDGSLSERTTTATTTTMKQTNLRH